MDVYDVVRTVLAVRAYKNTKLPAEIVRKIVDAGRLTASSMNGQPWHFIVVEDTNMLRKLAGLAKTGPYISQAPMVIVVAIENTQYAMSDASRAIQSMILTAWGEGIGSNWVGFGKLKEINTTLGIPESLEVFAIIPFGYPAENKIKGIKKRKAFSEVVHRENYSQSFE